MFEIFWNGMFAEGADSLFERIRCACGAALRVFATRSLGARGSTSSKDLACETA